MTTTSKNTVSNNAAKSSLRRLGLIAALGLGGIILIAWSAVLPIIGLFEVWNWIF